MRHPERKVDPMSVEKSAVAILQRSQFPVVPDCDITHRLGPQLFFRLVRPIDSSNFASWSTRSSSSLQS